MKYNYLEYSGAYAAPECHQVEVVSGSLLCQSFVTKNETYEFDDEKFVW